MITPRQVIEMVETFLNENDCGLFFRRIRVFDLPGGMQLEMQFGESGLYINVVENECVLASASIQNGFRTYKVAGVILRLLDAVQAAKGA